MIWTNPLEAEVDPRDPSKISLPDFDLGASSVSSVTGLEMPQQKQKSKEERLVKAYTIPDNATLLGSVSMTALLGRIPIGGRWLTRIRSS